MSKDMTAVFITWNNSLSSQNTIKRYDTSVKLFCKMVFNEEPTEINSTDLKRLRYSDTINKFVKPLRDKRVKDSTIKSHLIAMRSFVRMIRREKIYRNVDFSDLETYVLKVDNLANRDIHHHSPMSLKELHEMEKWLKDNKNNNRKKLGDKYALLIDFMYSTAIRSSATFLVRWEDFQVVDSPYGGEWAELNVMDKGRKLNTKYLHKEYYEELKSIFYNGKDTDEVYRELSQNTLRQYFKEYSEVIGRNIVIHSLKAGAATTLYSETKDLMLVRDFCDHESVKTTEAYIHTQPNPNETGTAILTTNYDYEKIDGLSKEQLLMLIHSRPEIESTIYLAGVNHKVL